MVLPEIKEKIGALKAERKAVILAHNYQTEEIQELADYTGIHLISAALPLRWMPKS